MKQNKTLPLICAAGGMLLLILDSQTALSGAAEGIELCLRTVIPSLFPFFVVSVLLTGAMLGRQAAFLRPLAKLLRIPEGTEPLLLAGFLGGYPVGARCVADAWKNGALSRQEAERMIAFCNNAGPSFLFGMIGCMFPRRWMVWALWGVHIVSALITALVLPGGSCRKAIQAAPKQVTLTAALSTAIHAMAGVCGWVVVFRVLIAFLERWVFWMLPMWGRIAVSGSLELANGCCSLAAVSNIGQRFVLCAGMLGFGGLCVCLQTKSVTAGLSLGQYIKGKVLNGALSILISSAVAMLPTMEHYSMNIAVMSAALCSVVLLAHFLRKGQKKNSILTPGVV